MKPWRKQRTKQRLNKVLKITEVSKCSISYFTFNGLKKKNKNRVCIGMKGHLDLGSLNEHFHVLVRL